MAHFQTVLNQLEIASAMLEIIETIHLVDTKVGLLGMRHFSPRYRRNLAKKPADQTV